MTDTTVSSLLVQDNDSTVAFAGVIVYASFVVSFNASSGSSPTNSIASTGIIGFTFTSITFVTLLPSVAETLILAVASSFPFAIPVTTPFSDTDAISGVSLVHLTAGYVAVAGDTVACNCKLAVAKTSGISGVTAISVTLIISEIT